MSEWQPIETAPKDGSDILLFGLPNEVASLKPLISPGWWKRSDGLMKPGYWMLWHAVGPSFSITHWMPIPEPPK